MMRSATASPSACQPGRVAVADTITCVDCGGTCRRLPIEAPELGWQPGDVVTYRCCECVDVWYVEVHPEDLREIPRPGGPTGT
jgi:hypothetical protein